MLIFSCSQLHRATHTAAERAAVALCHDQLVLSVMNRPENLTLRVHVSKLLQGDKRDGTGIHACEKAVHLH